MSSKKDCSLRSTLSPIQFSCEKISSSLFLQTLENLEILNFPDELETPSPNKIQEHCKDDHIDLLRYSHPLGNTRAHQGGQQTYKVRIIKNIKHIFIVNDIKIVKKISKGPERSEQLKGKRENTTKWNTYHPNLTEP